MSEELRSILLGTAGLDVAACIALVLTASRGGVTADPPRLQAAGRGGIGAVVVQAVHFVEELATRFHERFPALLGLAGWPTVFFVTFNLFWLAVWVLSIQGLAGRQRVALFPLWFLALGCVANGVAHPAFAAVTGGYFPGLVSAAFVGLAGVVLVRRLFAVADSTTNCSCGSAGFGR